MPRWSRGRHGQPFLTLDHDTDGALPEGTDDVWTPRAYVEHFLERVTDPGDAVFDPFAGFDTTPAVAGAMDRIPSGIVYEPERVALVRDRLADPSRIEQGNAGSYPPATCRR